MPDPMTFVWKQKKRINCGEGVDTCRALRFLAILRSSEAREGGAFGYVKFHSQVGDTLHTG